MAFHFALAIVIACFKVQKASPFVSRFFRLFSWSCAISSFYGINVLFLILGLCSRSRVPCFELGFTFEFGYLAVSVLLGLVCFEFGCF